MADIIIFALVAGFIAWRLYSVLGKQVDVERKQDTKEPLKPVSILRGPANPEAAPMAPVPLRVVTPAVELPKKLAEKAEKIQALDPNFTPEGFLQGARAAFEMIFDAFNAVDKKTLSGLLSHDLYSEFEAEFAASEKEGRVTANTLIALVKAEIQDIALKASTARVTVAFTSEQVSLVKNKEGAILEGDPSLVEMVEDAWVFERNVKSANPNWALVEIIT